MKRIGWIATLATVALLAAGCRPTGPEPSDRAPAVPPTVEADAPATTGQPAADQAGTQEAQDTQPEPAGAPSEPAGASSERGVLGAVGKALISSFGGKSKDEPPEAPRF